MEEDVCNLGDENSSVEWKIPSYYKKRTQRGRRPGRPQGRQDRPRYTVIIKPTGAVKITSVDSGLLWITFQKFLSSACENDQIGYGVNNKNNFITVTVRTEQRAQDLWRSRSCPQKIPARRFK